MVYMEVNTRYLVTFPHKPEIQNKGALSRSRHLKFSTPSMCLKINLSHRLTRMSHSHPNSSLFFPWFHSFHHPNLPLFPLNPRCRSATGYFNGYCNSECSTRRLAPFPGPTGKAAQITSPSGKCFSNASLSALVN